jgi:hypothetical protein
MGCEGIRRVRDNHEIAEQDRTSSVERLLSSKVVEGAPQEGRPLSRRARQTQRSVEAYLKAGVRPRWMERLGEIDGAIAAEKQRIARAYRALQEECGTDRHAFARRWRAVARAWVFEDLNELIRQHNDWYPIERQLPMDPRTGDYVRFAGRSYRRPVLGPAWVLEQFPASPPDSASRR